MTFYRSHGTYCAETTLKSALSLKGIEKKISELIASTRHEKGKGLWPVELASAFLDLNIQFDYPVKPEFKQDLFQEELKRKIKGHYGQIDGSRIIIESNLSNILRSQKRILNTGLFQLKEERNINLERNIGNGRLALVLINSDKYFGREDKNHGHYILVFGQERNNFRYYDCGPKSFNVNGKMNKREFYEISNGISMIDWGILLI